MIKGCIPEAAYYANYVGGNSFLNDKYLRVDYLDYPVFAMRENRKAPVNINSNAMKADAIAILL